MAVGIRIIKKNKKNKKNYVWEFTKLKRTVGGLLDIHHNEESWVSKKDCWGRNPESEDKKVSFFTVKEKNEQSIK